MEELKDLKGRIDDYRSNISDHLASTWDVDTGSAISPFDRSSEPLDSRCRYSSFSTSSSSKIQCSLDRLRILTSSSNTLTKEIDSQVCSDTNRIRLAVQQNEHHLSLTSSDGVRVVRSLCGRRAPATICSRNISTRREFGAGLSVIRHVCARYDRGDGHPSVVGLRRGRKLFHKLALITSGLAP